MKKYYYNNELAYQELSCLEDPASPSLLSFINIIYERESLKNARILDLGCGMGAVTAKFLEVTSEVTGVDISPSAIALAKSNYPEINFCCLDFVNDDLGKDYQLIFDSHSLHGIVFDDERDKVFANIYSALKPGGFFAMETMVCHDEMVLKDNYYFDQHHHLFKRVGNSKFYDIREIEGESYLPYRRILPSYLIEEELKKAGFTIIYLIVSSSQKMVIDSDWPFAIHRDPDRMRVICIREDE